MSCCGTSVLSDDSVVWTRAAAPVTVTDSAMAPGSSTSFRSRSAPTVSTLRALVTRLKPVSSAMTV